VILRLNLFHKAAVVITIHIASLAMVINLILQTKATGGVFFVN
ncbi:uncharacterized protein METZ01_LOCUS288287, partial [marine metagenome]